jgi:hypothetical protein
MVRALIFMDQLAFYGFQESGLEDFTVTGVFAQVRVASPKSSSDRRTDRVLN